MIEGILDDDDLLKDRLLRSLHRNNDGHLAVQVKHHEKAVTESHNAAVLYIYTRDGRAYTLHEHYVYSFDPRNYKEWNDAVKKEIERIILSKPKDWHGVYGWLTSTIVITPLRTGDLLIKVDKDGARGVRLSFDTRKAKHEAHKEKAKQKNDIKRHRIR
jgi:hypothetical protein